MSILVYREPSLNTTVVCNFKADWTWTTSVNSLLNIWDFCQKINNSLTVWTDWTLRLSIVATDESAVIYLWWTNWNWAITNLWYSNWWRAWIDLKQKLIKKASLKISTIHQDWYSDCFIYPSYNCWWVFATFSKHINNTNWWWWTQLSDVSRAGFVFNRSVSSTWYNHNTYPADPNVQYLALPSHTNTWVNTTSSSYIDQWVSCIDSIVTLETRWTWPNNFHYRLIVEKTWNEYDLWLCSDLWSCNLAVESFDWWRVWSYKEIDYAYLEYFNDYYIDENWNITNTRPR